MLKARKLFLILLLLALAVGVQCCFSRSSKSSSTESTTLPTTTTTEHYDHREAVHEVIQENSISANQAYPRGGGHGGHGGQKSSVSTGSLKRLSEELYRLDSNSVASLIAFNQQGLTTSSDRKDHAPNPLFSRVGGSTLDGPTFQKLESLLNNYDPNVKMPEQDSKAEKREQEAFLDEVMKTRVMKRLEEFLQQNHLIRGPLKPALKEIWFTPYSRAKSRRGNPILGSSGFEHIFAGEIKNGKVSGFHNWVFFLREEQSDAIDYMGHMKVKDLGSKADLVKMKFLWNDREKSYGSMFIGTSPELEMALYTLCFYTRPNKNCYLKMNGSDIRIKVYTQPFGGKKLIGTAYPDA